jgi:hypothetical protein
MRHERRRSVGAAPTSSDVSPTGRAVAAWHGYVLLFGGWVCIGSAHALVSSSNDPASGPAVVFSAGAFVLSVGAVGSGVAVLNAAAMSPSRRVFHSGPAFMVAVWLLAMAVTAGTLLIWIEPFDGIAAHGKPLSNVLVDLGAIAALSVCLSGGVFVLRNALRARRDERSWNR